MNLWIQRSDFTTIEDESVSEEEALRALEEHDWNEEREREQQAAESGGENCPAGLGLIADDKSVLHIVPGEDGGSHVFFHAQRRKRLLGLIPIDVPISDDRVEVSVEEVRQLIALHFAGQTDALLDLLRD